MKMTEHVASIADAAAVRLQFEIEAIARETHRPFAEVAAVFTEMYTELRSRATVTDFLPLFVARKVRALYKSMR